MPPEVIKDRISYPASDMWSLGVALFKSTMGKYPYDGKNIKDIFVKIKNNDRRILKTSPRNKLLEKIIKHLLIHNIYLRMTPDQIIELTDDIESMRPEEAKYFKYPKKRSERSSIRYRGFSSNLGELE